MTFSESLFFSVSFITLHLDLHSLPGLPQPFISLKETLLRRMITIISGAACLLSLFLSLSLSLFPLARWLAWFFFSPPHQRRGDERWRVFLRTLSLVRPSLTHLLLYSCSLESRLKSVYIESPREVNLESRGGNVKVAAYGVISVHAQEQLSVDSRNVHFTGLQASHLAVSQQEIPSLQVSSTNHRSETKDSNFWWLISLVSLSLSFPQVCACESGALFTVPGDRVCSTDACDQETGRQWCPDNHSIISCWQMPPVCDFPLRSKHLEPFHLKACTFSPVLGFYSIRKRFVGYE